MRKTPDPHGVDEPVGRQSRPISSPPVAPVALRAFVLLAILASACTLTKVTRGKPLDPQAVSGLKVGDSRASVLTRLGPPTSTEIVRGGTRFHYVYKTEDEKEISMSPGQGSVTWGKENYQLDRITVLFDHQGRVAEIGWPHGIGMPPGAPQVATKEDSPAPSDRGQTAADAAARLSSADAETGSKRP